jgi:hypothetical protein
MSTGDHLNHRFCGSYLEAAQGVVVRVVVLGKNGQNTKPEWVVQAQNKTIPLTAKLPFLQHPNRDLALGLPFWLVTHGIKRPKKIGRKEQVIWSSGSTHFYQQLIETALPGEKLEGWLPALRESWLQRPPV